MPTLQEMKDIYKDMPEDESSQEHHVWFDKFKWYCNLWMEACAGAGHNEFGRAVRTVKMFMQPVVVDGKKYNAAPPQAEALGLIIFENCLPKWEEEIPKKFLNEKVDKKVVNRLTAYSDPKEARKWGGGFGADVHAKYEDCIREIEASRNADKKDGYKMHKLALKAIRLANGLPGEVPKKNAGKRKRPTGETNLEPHRKRPVRAAALKPFKPYTPKCDYSSGGEE